MKKIILGVLIISFMVLLGINIKILSKTKNCSYEIKTEYYEEKINVSLSYFKDYTITKKYIFNDETILEKEKELIEKDDYNVKVDGLELSASKKVKNKNYYKNIKEYEELGFECK